MKKSFLLLFILQYSFVFAQFNEIIFVDDVEAIEYFGIKICVGENGETISAAEIPKQTTYKNKRIIRKIIHQADENTDLFVGSGLSNECIDLKFTLINSKYETPQILDADCKANFEKGRFAYKNPMYEDVKIKRRKNRQIETTNNIRLVLEIKWISPCNYELTYLKTNSPILNPYIGKKIDIKILDIFDDQKYLYHTISPGEEASYGLIEKL